MEKSPTHFRASQPLLFISSILLAGLIFAKLFVQELLIVSISEATYLLLFSLILLQFIIARSPTYPNTHTTIHSYTFSLSKDIEGLLVYLILFSWGILLFFLTKEKNLFQILDKPLILVLYISDISDKKRFVDRIKLDHS